VFTSTSLPHFQSSSPRQNERAAELIFQHADLLDSPELWPLMLQLVAHTSALKVRGRGRGAHPARVRVQNT
jgi:hypothetical protein